MRSPVVSLVIQQAAVRPFNTPSPGLGELACRVVDAASAGAFNIHQPVSAVHADEFLSLLLKRAVARGVQLVVILPTGEMIDSSDYVLRPAVSLGSTKSPVAPFPRAIRGRVAQHT